MRQRKFMDTLRQRKHIDDVLVYLDQAYDEQVDLSQVADISCYSPFHFQRLFSGFMGEPWYEYLRRQRLLIAAHRLLSTNEKIYDIAMLAGFSTQTGFLKAFKNWYGCTPKQYRCEFSGEPFPTFIPVISSRCCSELTPVLVHLKPATLFVECGKGMVNGHFDQVAWDALSRLLIRIRQNRELQSFFPSFVCHISCFSELFKGNNAEFNIGLAVDRVVMGNSGSFKCVQVDGGLYAELIHFGPLFEHSLHKLVFEWLPQSRFSLHDKRPIIYSLRSIPSELYDGASSLRLKNKQLIYEGFTLTEEKLAACSTYILIPLSENNVDDSLWQSLEPRDLVISS